MVAELPQIATVLKDKGYSLTAPRRAVFNALVGTEALSMSELVEKVSPIDRATVYRTVELFENLGVINRLQFGWKYKLELSDLFSEHHHHATCTNCGKMIALHEDPETEASIHQLAQQHNFAISSHSLEIRGLCPACQKQP